MVDNFFFFAISHFDGRWMFTAQTQLCEMIACFIRLCKRPFVNSCTVVMELAIAQLSTSTQRLSLFISKIKWKNMFESLIYVNACCVHTQIKRKIRSDGMPIWRGKNYSFLLYATRERSRRISNISHAFPLYKQCSLLTAHCQKMR